MHGTYIREAEKAGVVPFELPPNKRQDTHTHTLLPTPRALLPAPQGSGLLQRVTAPPPPPRSVPADLLSVGRAVSHLTPSYSQEE